MIHFFNFCFLKASHALRECKCLVSQKLLLALNNGLSQYRQLLSSSTQTSMTSDEIYKSFSQTLEIQFHTLHVL